MKSTLLFLLAASCALASTIGTLHNTGLASQYVYATTFDLTGFDPTTAFIEFAWAVDNALTDVRLNGMSIGHAFPTTSNFTFQAPVTLSSGFERGLNLLEFKTRNFSDAVTGNPNGLRIEFESNVDPLAAPEPASIILIAAGLSALLLISRTKNKSSQSPQ